MGVMVEAGHNDADTYSRPPTYALSQEGVEVPQPVLHVHQVLRRQPAPVCYLVHDDQGPAHAAAVRRYVHRFVALVNEHGHELAHQACRCVCVNDWSV